MHLAEVIVPIVATAAVVPGLIALHVTRVWRNAQRRGGGTGAGVVLADGGIPALARHWIGGAFAVRDEHVLDTLLTDIGRGGRILEVGCGDCRLLKKLCDAGFDAHGIDLDPGCIGAAKALDLSDRVRLGDFIRAQLGIEPFDAVLFCDSIRYTWLPHTALKRSTELANYVLVTEPLDFVHMSGRLIFMRFLFRAGHIARLQPRVLSRCIHRRRHLHHFWIWSRDVCGPVLQSALAEEARNEATDNNVIRPAVLDLFRRAVWLSAGSVLAATLLLYWH